MLLGISSSCIRIFVNLSYRAVIISNENVALVDKPSSFDGQKLA